MTSLFQVVKILFLKNNTSPHTHIHTYHSQSVLLCSSVPSRVRLFTTPWTVRHQAPLSTGFSRQESWSGLPFPPPGDLPNPRISLMSLGLLHCRWNLYHQAAWEAPLPSHTVQTVYIVSVSDGNSLACLSDGGEWSQVCMDS